MDFSSSAGSRHNLVDGQMCVGIRFRSCLRGGHGENVIEVIRLFVLWYKLMRRDFEGGTTVSSSFRNVGSCSLTIDLFMGIGLTGVDLIAETGSFVSVLENSSGSIESRGVLGSIGHDRGLSFVRDCVPCDLVFLGKGLPGVMVKTWASGALFRAINQIFKRSFVVMNFRFVDLVIGDVSWIAVFENKFVSIYRSSGTGVSSIGVAGVMNLGLIKEECNVFIEVESGSDSRSFRSSPVKIQDLSQVGSPG